MSNKDNDFLRRTEDIINNASLENRRPLPITPSKEAYFYFMGGAYAGEILKDNIEVTSADAIPQLHLEYLDDPADIGDLGELFNYINEEGFSVITLQNQSRRTLTNPLPTYRVFFIKDGALFGSTRQGLLPKDQQRAMVIEKPLKITNDEKLANQLYSQIAALPRETKGRDLFAIFTSSLVENQRFKLHMINRQNAPLDFDEEDLDAIMSGYPGSETHARLWFLHHRGKVPATWERWYFINDDLEEIKDKPVPDEWLDAAVTHPSWHVVTTAYENFTLTMDQLAIVFVQAGKGYRREEVIACQTLRGLNHEEIIAAQTLAKEQGFSLLEKKLQS